MRKSPSAPGTSATSHIRAPTSMHGFWLGAEPPRPVTASGQFALPFERPTQVFIRNNYKNRSGARIIPPVYASRPGPMK